MMSFARPRRARESTEISFFWLFGRARDGPDDLCRSGRREGCPRLFRRSHAPLQARCGRRGGFPPLHDSFAEAAARRGRLGRDRPRTAALARPGARRAIVPSAEPIALPRIFFKRDLYKYTSWQAIP